MLTYEKFKKLFKAEARALDEGLSDCISIDVDLDGQTVNVYFTFDKYISFYLKLSEQHTVEFDEWRKKDLRYTAALDALEDDSPEYNKVLDEYYDHRRYVEEVVKIITTKQLRKDPDRLQEAWEAYQFYK